MPHHGSARPNQVRIIGGRFRSRKLAFPAVTGLRPTGDRVRETLFNWLAPDLPGARCLDLFAGSGALGIEALSRGAAHVTFVDTSREACTALLQNLDRLDVGLRRSGTAEVACADGLTWLDGPRTPCDIVFLDPPFSAGLFERCAAALDRSAAVQTGTRIYLEQPKQDGELAVPARWETVKDKQAGQVRYRLFRIPDVTRDTSSG